MSQKQNNKVFLLLDMGWSVLADVKQTRFPPSSIMAVITVISGFDP